MGGDLRSRSSTVYITDEADGVEGAAWWLKPVPRLKSPPSYDKLREEMRKMYWACNSDWGSKPADRNFNGDPCEDVTKILCAARPRGQEGEDKMCDCAKTEKRLNRLEDAIRALGSSDNQAHDLVCNLALSNYVVVGGAVYKYRWEEILRRPLDGYNSSEWAPVNPAEVHPEVMDALGLEWTEEEED